MWNSTLKQKKPLVAKKSLARKSSLRSNGGLSKNNGVALKKNKPLDKTKKSNQARALDITQEVKNKVFERDGKQCVVCGNMINVMPNAHFIPRSKGGMGVEENVVTLCTNLTVNNCHHKFDNGIGDEQKEYRKKIEKYLKSKYPEWNKENVIYRK